MTYSSHTSDFTGNFLNPHPQKKYAMHPLRLSSFKEGKKINRKRGNLNDILRSIQTMLPLGSEKESRRKYFLSLQM